MMQKKKRILSVNSDHQADEIKKLTEKLSKINPNLKGSSKQLDVKMAEMQRMIKKLPPDQRKQAAEIWGKFEMFAKGGVEGVKRGIPYFQQLMTELQKKT